MRTRVFPFVALFLAFCGSTLFGQTDLPTTRPARESASKTIEILGWYGPPSTIDHLRSMANAGFTMSFDNRFANVEAALAGLDAAKTAGVRLLVWCPQLKSDPQATAARLKSHPALGGYFIQDEPAASSFAELAQWVRQLRAADPNHPAYINLFPNYATADQLGVPTYPQYLDDFIKMVPVPYLSFDHYPVIQAGGAPASLRANWYENLEQASGAARKADLPLWAFALSTRHYSYPTPTLAHLRVQVFSDLAYGAQTIQYFTYWQVSGNDPPFDDAPVDRDGKPTPVYDRVKQVNAEIRGLADAFAGSKIVAIGHTGKTIPAGTHRYEPRSPIANIKTEGAAGGGALVSLLTKGDRRFLAVVNRDINAPLQLTVTLDNSPQAKAMQRLEKDGSRHALAGQDLQAAIEPGDIAVFVWQEAANP